MTSAHLSSMFLTVNLNLASKQHMLSSLIVTIAIGKGTIFETDFGTAPQHIRNDGRIFGKRATSVAFLGCMLHVLMFSTTMLSLLPDSV